MHRWQSASSSRPLEPWPMADNPFDPKPFGLLAAIGGEPYSSRSSTSSSLRYRSPKPPHGARYRRSVDRGIETVLPRGPLPPLYGSGLDDMFGPTASARIEKPSVSALASLMASPPPFFAPPTPLTSSFGSLAHFVGAPEPSPLSPLYAPSQKPQADRARDQAQGIFQLPLRRHHACQ